MDKLEPVPELTAECYADLQTWQTEIDNLRAFSAKKAEAKKLFSSKNRKNNDTFVEIRSNLKSIAPSKSRCFYCQANELQAIEHFRPKAHFPEHTFVWNNYLYACERCNREKLNHFCVHDPLGNSTEWYDFPAKKNAPEVPEEVRKNNPVLLNPRFEDPLAFLMLDLLDTFNFIPRFKSGSIEYFRAIYTIERLKLNARGFLIDSREQAFDSYLSHLEGYIRDGQDHYKARIKRISFTAVWREMKRQSQREGSKLKALFDAAPEARDW